MKRTYEWRWGPLRKFAQTFCCQAEITGDDVDLLFLGTSPERLSCPSRLWPRKNKNPRVVSASPAASEGETNTPHRLSCSAGQLTSSLLGWRTWQGSPLMPPSWRGNNERTTVGEKGGFWAVRWDELCQAGFSMLRQYRKLGDRSFKVIRKSERVWHNET